MKRMLLPIGAIAVAGITASALTVPAQANQVSSSDKLVGAAKAGAVLKFWLSNGGSRLKAADPYGVEHNAVPKHVSTGGTAADGRPGTVAASGGGAPATSSKNVNLPRTVGRVFFVLGRNLYSCSASSVQSQYRNLVVTAGHCVYDIESNGQVVDNWVFIPAYYDGKAPYGVYVGKQAFTHYDFDVYEDADRDYAFVTVYNGIGYDARKDAFVDLGPLGKNVGAQGLAYNQKVGAPVFAFGYPALPHGDGDWVYTGEKLKYCYGKPVYPVKEASAKVEEHMGLRCSMTGGSSGGPWILRYSNASRLGYVNGVISLGGDTDGNNRSDLITSPYFDGETYGVYKAARSLWSGSLVRKDGSIGITEVASR